MKKEQIIIGISFLFLLIVIEVFSWNFVEKKAVAQEYYRLPITTIQIDRHGICRNVVNPTSQTFFVPIKTQGEWTSFIRASSGLGLSTSYCVRCEWRRSPWTCGNKRLGATWRWTAPAPPPLRLVCETYNVGSID